jgi:hypothetical protein
MSFVTRYRIENPCQPLRELNTVKGLDKRLIRGKSPPSLPPLMVELAQGVCNALRVVGMDDNA